MHDTRLSFENENEIQALWNLVSGSISPDDFKQQYPSVYKQIEQKAGSTS